jgi:hypothetical protein
MSSFDVTGTCCILYVLQELGVRSLEPLDVISGYVLPQMTQWASRVQAHEAAAAASSSVDTDMSPPGGATAEASAAAPAAAAVQAPALAAAAAAVAATSKHLMLKEGEAQQLMRLLAFPLAAGLLDMDLQDSSSSSSSASVEQQQQRAGQGRGSSATGQQPQSTPRRQLDFSNPAAAAAALTSGTPPTKLQKHQLGQAQRLNLLQQLAQVAVLVTASGQARLACSSSSSSNAQGSDLEDDIDDGILYLPKQLGNALDLTSTFPAYPWTLLDPGYAAACPVAVIPAEKWAQLFKALGVQQFLPLPASPRVQACSCAGRSCSQIQGLGLGRMLCSRGRWDQMLCMSFRTGTCLRLTSCCRVSEMRQLV